MRRSSWTLVLSVPALVASGLLACSAAKDEGGTGGSGKGGATTAGGSGGGAGLGGRAAAGGFGGGAGTGGSGGSAGMGGGTAAGGGGGGGTTTSGATGTDGKLCAPPQSLITDFTHDSSADTTQVHFGSAGTLGGGEYIYPTTGTYPLTSDVTGDSWHISGEVGDYSGFGLYFDNCSRIDASAYQGISFKVSGLVEQDGGITFQIDTLNDTIAATWLNTHGGSVQDGAPGRCLPPDSAPNQWAQTTCAEPTQSIPVTDTPTVQTILWTDFSGGKPDTSVNPSDIVSIHWFFPNPAGVGTGSVQTYKVDITLDDLSFVSK
jgi:hypothetical protein